MCNNVKYTVATKAFSSIRKFAIVFEPELTFSQHDFKCGSYKSKRRLLTRQRDRNTVMDQYWLFPSPTPPRFVFKVSFLETFLVHISRHKLSFMTPTTNSLSLIESKLFSIFHSAIRVPKGIYYTLFIRNIFIFFSLIYNSYLSSQSCKCIQVLTPILSSCTFNTLDLIASDTDTHLSTYMFILYVSKYLFPVNYLRQSC